MKQFAAWKKSPRLIKNPQNGWKKSSSKWTKSKLLRKDNKTMHRMVNWNFQRKLMRENMRKALGNLDASESRDNKGELTFFGDVYLYEGVLVKLVYKTTAETAVAEILEGEDKGKTTTIYLNKATLIKERK